MEPAEIACSLSHLQAIKYFIEETSHERVMIMEDDVDVSTAQFWNFTWNDLMHVLPQDFDTVQLTVMNQFQICMSLHPRSANDFSAAAYIVTRRHAQRLYQRLIHGSQFRLDIVDVTRGSARPVAEEVMLSSGKAYTLPIFLYKPDMGSAIMTMEEIERFHELSHRQVRNFWTTKGSQHTIDQLMHSEIMIHRPVEEVNQMLKKLKIVLGRPT
eukprot:gnl/MRDRNA2_/MRDRNA2_203721_c0_seq1.p1 gnl/MRDRNA2_/MRDRNA2_203721_c0~~gnl/MRDRNA2_/MRDRNA2_203721_c0_seq1.p1  ORF type:complete len:240 (+),score=37.19 gnl/MRDRNA2_/MRDRNA2_203721_c0_seq1:84-722(+)